MCIRPPIIINIAAFISIRKLKVKEKELAAFSCQLLAYNYLLECMWVQACNEAGHNI